MKKLPARLVSKHAFCQEAKHPPDDRPKHGMKAQRSDAKIPQHDGREMLGHLVDIR
jgi:hypothetical protein